MAQIATSFPDTTYSSATKPNVVTLQQDITAIETGYNAHDASTAQHGVATAVAGTTDTQTLTNKTLTSPLFNGTVDGWISANETWTYASASTITVPSGAASKYKVGDKIKWTQTTVKYGVIRTVADTLLTIIVNTDYVVTNAAISANSYSHASTPLGFPGVFSWTPSFTNFGGGTSTFVGKWSVNNGVFDFFTVSTLAGSGCGVFGSVSLANLPVTANASYATNKTGEVILSDGSTHYFGVFLDGSGVYTINVAGSLLGIAALSSTAPFTWAAGDSIKIDGKILLT